MKKNYFFTPWQCYLTACFMLLLSQNTQAQTRQKNRTIDGTLNNLSSTINAKWGAAGIPLFRELPAEYGTKDPKNAMGGANRPTPRLISNVLSDEPQDIQNARDLSGLTYIWGQFLDHDITFSPSGTTESVPIALPSDEKIFSSPIPFKRSIVQPGTGVTTPREQTNVQTSWIDGSQVYGADAATAKWLRAFSSGKLKVSTGNMLPFNTLTGEFNSPIDLTAPKMDDDNNRSKITFVAGDPRAAEHPGLASLHTLFVREHNKICDRLKAQGLTNDEDIYQKARKEIGALMQAITYGQWLSALGVKLKDYAGYNTAVRPDIMNTFSTAAYRWHTMVENDIIFRDNNCRGVGPVELPLKDVFFNINIVRKYDIGVLLKGLSVHQQYETDLKVNHGLRNFLFGPGSGLDLVSLNLQRGRDHGLPNYNTVRQFYTGKAIKNIKDINPDGNITSKIQSLYGTVDNIDLWVGLFAEPLEKGKSVGKTLDMMIQSQFEKLRDGDYYFYLNDPELASERTRIQATKLSDVIARNSNAGNFQDNVFFRKHCDKNGDDIAQFACNSAPVLEGWTYLGTQGTNQYFKWNGTTAMNYASAKLKVETLGGHLPMIKDAALNTFITSKLGGKSAWLDIVSDGKNFKYSDGKKIPYFNWQIGQPDNVGGIEFNAVISTTGFWNDINGNTANLNSVIAEVPCGAPLLALQSSESLVLDARAELNRTFVQWVNNTGFKNDYFTVEKVNNTTGQFEEWTIINNQSFDNSLINYTTYDNAPTEGDNTYRIKVFYQDGTFKVSEAKTVNFKGLSDVRIFPNPANDVIGIDLSNYKDKAVEIYLYNYLGQQILSQKIDKVENTVIEMNVANQQTGNYMMRIKSKGNRDITKSVVITH